jgi:hypothetical protein
MSNDCAADWYFRLTHSKHYTGTSGPPLGLEILEIPTSELPQPVGLFGGWPSGGLTSSHQQGKPQLLLQHSHLSISSATKPFNVDLFADLHSLYTALTATIYALRETKMEGSSEPTSDGAPASERPSRQETYDKGMNSQASDDPR